jgi:hypothetical protein
MAGKRLGVRGTVEIDGITIRAPGLTGEVSVEEPAAGGARGGRVERGPVADAMRANGMATRRVITIDRAREAPRPAAGARGGRRPASPTIDLTVPAPPRGEAQVVLATDEHGVKTWHFAEQGEEGAGRSGTRGGRRTQRYSIRRTAPVRVATDGSTADRGGIPGIAKVIELVTFPVAELAAAGVDFAVGRWDRREHPHRLRSLDGGAWRQSTAEDLDSLSSGPALLFVHGTFSTTEGAFASLPAATMTELHERYEGRVIAFDHPTIADDPIENARQFFELVGDRKLELDIVCHSRGGLVARAIAERPDGFGSEDVHVNRIVLVGVPNGGTILADAAHWNELVDRFTTILSLFPLPGAGDVLESVFALVRSIAVRTAKKLDGLAAMTPGGPFLQKLNAERGSVGDTKYLAVVSDYEPKNPGLKAWLNDEIRDRIFDLKPNDMMVRIDSMCGDELAKPFPVVEADRVAFAKGDAIEHAIYFPAQKTSKALLDWLPRAAVPVP